MEIKQVRMVSGFRRGELPYRIYDMRLELVDGMVEHEHMIGQQVVSLWQALGINSIKALPIEIGQDDEPLFVLFSSRKFIKASRDRDELEQWARTWGLA